MTHFTWSFYNVWVYLLPSVSAQWSTLSLFCDCFYIVLPCYCFIRTSLGAFYCLFIGLWVPLLLLVFQLIICVNRKWSSIVFFCSYEIEYCIFIFFYWTFYVFLIFSWIGRILLWKKCLMCSTFFFLIQFWFNTHFWIWKSSFK